MKKNAFTLLTEREMTEVRGCARLWRHCPTGAQILSVSNDDENKCFGVTLRTPPADSTGVAHILEHSVLCGSDKYPVKEPFVELLKGSLQTFLNAFTFPDKTCYPVASTNLQDFYNLIDVYIDAVFHPRITENIFRQEGWHVEATSADGPWTYKGVVFNEMKGVYSSPDSMLAEQSQHAVFPDMLYSFDSGGNPEHIPALSYTAFRDFHSRYYHPSNARFFFWGDDPEDERLRIICTALNGYTARPVDSGIPLQQSLPSPRRIKLPYAAESEQRAMFTVNWLLAERGNIAEALRMEMLEHILEGLPGSPLRRALISSGLGEDLAGCGLETDLRQMYYSTGLKGILPDDVAKAEEIILDTLVDLAGGVPSAAVEAAVNSVEFAYRENNSGRFPRGLAAMIQALSTWLYDEDPLTALAWEAPLRDIKEKLSHGERLFEQVIAKNFLKNSHRATVILIPDTSLGTRREAAEKERLAGILAETDPAGRICMVEETLRLQAAQTAPDSPEALASIPRLGVNDLPRENTPIPCKEHRTPSTCLFHELPTQGIAYASLLLPLTRVPARLLPLLPLFARSLTEIGTARRDFTALGTLMAAKTGGMGANCLTGVVRETRSPFAYLAFGGKAVYEKLPDMFAILRETLLEPLRDEAVLRERFGQMLLEDKARLEQGLLTSGNVAVGVRLRARYTAAAGLCENTGGLSYLESVRRLLAQLERAPGRLLADMETLRQSVIAGDDAVFDCTAEATGLDQTASLARELLADLPKGGHLPRDAGQPDWACPMSALPQAEAFLAPTSINYVGKGINLFDMGYAWHGSASVILRYMRMGYLWERVRVRGGAYGAACSLDRLSGTLVCTSYRDPNVEQTLDIYDGMATFLREFTPDDAQLAQAIVGAVGDLDAYLLPDAKGGRALSYWLTNDTDEARQQLREEMLSTTARDFRQFAEALDCLRDGAVCVLGGPATEAVAREHGWGMHRLLES